MRVVAFRRLKHTPNRGTNHEELIVEFAYTDLHPKRYHQEAQGYEVVYEDKFEIEFAKNEVLIEEFNSHQEQVKKHLLQIEKEKEINERIKVKQQHIGV